MKIEDAQAQIEALKAERGALLDELESAYRHLEEILTTKNYETDIAYQELRKRNQELQQRLVQLGKAHGQLREAQRLLVRSERMSAMGQMAAAIVHEINNPLTAISGRVELLLMKGGVSHRDEIERIQVATCALRDLARNILRFARHKSVDPAALAALPLNPVVDEVLDFFRPLMKRIDVETRLAPDLPQVWGNAAQIEQVLTNLLVNAADALDGWPAAHLVVSTGRDTLAGAIARDQARGRAVRLAISVPEADLEHAGVYAAVEDNGPGMEAAVMEQIFEAFFTTKGEGRGTGLGLSICRSIAESFEGNILVDSAAGRGAGFRLFLRPRPEGEPVR